MNRRQNGHLILSLSLAVSVLAVLLLLVAGQTVLAGEPIAADPIGLPIPARPLAQIQDPAVLSATPITGTVVPGAALPYMVTVVNTCTVPTTVTLACAHSRPADFTGSFVTETFTNVPAGQSVTTTLGVTPNLGTLAYIANVTAITATLDCTTTEYVAYVTTTVARQYGVELTALEPSARSTPPLVPVTFTLVITNAGNYTDTMTLTCTSVPSFTCELTPGLTLGPNVSGTACLTVTPDTGTPAGTPAVITTTAMAGDNNTTAQDVVTVTVSPIYGVDQAVTPTAAQVPAGGKQTYTVTVTNTGNTTDTFNLAYTDVYTGDNFSVVHPTTAITLPQSGTGTAFITVTAKAAAPAGARETTVVTATSRGDGGQSAAVAVTATVRGDFVTVRGRSVAPANAFQGQLVAMEALTLTAQTNSATWTGITVRQSGTCADGDITSVRIYRDANGNGVFDPGSDMLLDYPAAFSGGVASLTFKVSDRPTITTAPSPVYFVVYEIAGSTSAGVTAGARLDSANSVVLAAPDIPTGTFPLASGLATIQRVGVTVTVKPATATTPAGVSVSYTVTVTNTGTTTDTYDLTKADSKPADFTSSLPSPLGPIAAGKSLQATLTVTPAGSLPNGVSNTTVVTATSQNDPTKSDTGVVITTVSAPVLTITKTDSPDPVAAGGILTYTLTVTNTGNADATGVTITDVVPANTTFFTATVGGGLVGNQVRWTGQTVNAGGSLIVRFSVSVSDVASGTQITNQVYGVTCAQGVYKAGTPVDTRVEVITHTLCLPLVLKAYRAPSTAWSQGEGLKNVTVYGICVGKKSEKILYAGTDRHGIYRSTDGGNQWFPRGSVSSLVYAIATDPTDDQIVYAVTWGDGVLKTENGGDSWNKQNNGLEGNLWLDALAVYTGTIYVGTGDAGVYKSTDGGASWQSINSGLTNRNIRALAVDPTNSEVVYAGTTAGVYKTTNRGSSWAKTSLGDFTIWRIAVSPSNSQVVYAGTEGHGMYKTTDGGTQWSAVNNDLPESGSVTIYGLAIDSSNPNIVYAGTKGHGVYETTNGGDSWAAMNQGWEDTTIVEDLALDSADPPTLHAATKGGVYWWFWP